MPSGWLVLPVTGDDIGPLLDLLGQSQPDVAQLIRTYLDVSGAKVSLVGVDPALAAGGGLPPSAIVLLQPTLGFSLDLVGGVVGGALGRVPGVVGGVQKLKVALPQGDAIRFTFDVQTAAATGNIRLVQYLIVRGSQGYLVTFTTQASQIERDGPVFDRIIGSLTFP